MVNRPLHHLTSLFISVCLSVCRERLWIKSIQIEARSVLDYSRMWINKQSFCIPGTKLCNANISCHVDWSLNPAFYLSVMLHYLDNGDTRHHKYHVKLRRKAGRYRSDFAKSSILYIEYKKEWHHDNCTECNRIVVTFWEISLQSGENKIKLIIRVSFLWVSM
jgi:hypothetical protein